jgi:predicted DNA-binding protein
MKAKPLIKTQIYLFKPCKQKLDYISYRTSNSMSEIIRELLNSEKTLDALFKETALKFGNNIHID